MVPIAGRTIEDRSLCLCATSKADDNGQRENVIRFASSKLGSQSDKI